jgi:hypothetical protein
METWRAKREAYKNGQLSEWEARRFIKKDKEAFIEGAFKNSAVTYPDALRIAKLATPAEKPILDKLLNAKRDNLHKEHRDSEARKAEAEAAR